MIVLHHAWQSSASRRLRLCLEEKNLDYEGHVVNLEALEQHSDEYKKINPNGVVPTLIHDGRPLHESGTVCEYLDETYPDPPLRPDGAYDRALMRNWIRHIDGQIGNLVIFNWVHHLQQVAQKWTDDELAEVIKKIPSKERQEAWLRVARRPYTEEERSEARAKLVALLDRMEAAMEFVKRIEEEIAPDEMLSAKHPRVAHWWSSIQARPAFARAKIGPFLGD